MRSPVYLLTLFLLLAATKLCANDPWANDVRRNSLKGNVKSVSEISYKTKMRAGEIKKRKRAREYRWQRDFLVTFNEKGQKSGRVLYNSNGSVFQSTTYSYNAQGDLLAFQSTDAKGRVNSSFSYNYLYNDSAQKVKAVTHNALTKESYVFRYTREADGSSKTYRLYENNSRDSVLVRSFDKQGNLASLFLYGKNRSVLWKYTYTYNEQAAPTEELVYSGTELAIVYKWKYDEKGNLIEYDICRPSGENCEVWTYKYEFDVQGNWTKATEYRNGKPVFIKERAIVYF